MNVRWGRCFNFNKCKEAQQKHPIPIPQRAPFVCPECAEPLQDEHAFAPREAPAAPILRLAGSNTIGDTLGPSLAEAFLKDQGATEVRILPGANPQEKIVEGVLPGDTKASSITIAAHGSATAFTALAQNSCDIGMASRKIKPEEAAKLKSLGDMSSLQTSTSWVLTASPSLSTPPTLPISLIKTRSCASSPGRLPTGHKWAPSAERSRSTRE
jgi:hypothetical protein